MPPATGKPVAWTRRILGFGLASALWATASGALWASRPPQGPPSAPSAPDPRPLAAPLRGHGSPPGWPPPGTDADTEASPAREPPEPPARQGPATWGPPRRQKGVALGLFAEDVSFSYAPLLAEIAALGATHVALIVPIYQEHGASTSLYLHTRYSPSLEVVADTARLARREGLEVTLFPIVRLERPRTPTEWRGTLAPADEAAWFKSYEKLLGSLAALGSFTGASRLVVGSELSTLDGHVDAWRALITRVRAVFSGTLVYSANWDHYRDAGVLDLVDEAGITGYFDLRKPDGPADVASLAARWRLVRGTLEAWAATRKQPWLLTELGYRSRAGASSTPWDETAGGTPDLDEQRRAFLAFRLAFSEGGTLAGLYVWNWYGYGGPGTLGYTPRGKPAEAEVKQLLEAL